MMNEKRRDKTVIAMITVRAISFPDIPAPLERHWAFSHVVSTTSKSADRFSLAGYIKATIEKPPPQSDVSGEEVIWIDCKSYPNVADPAPELGFHQLPPGAFGISGGPDLVPNGEAFSGDRLRPAHCNPVDLDSSSSFHEPVDPIIRIEHSNTLC
jgi:hypothetical protein